MNQVNLQIDLLIESLVNKKSCLEKILSYTNEQAKLLKEDELDMDRFMKIMNDKETPINEIIAMDDGFKAIYEKIRGFIESQPELYREKIESMKKIIVEIGDLGVAITVQEGRNKNDFDLKLKKEKNKVKEFRHSKKTVTNYYSSLNKQNSTENSFFFDSKK